MTDIASDSLSPQGHNESSTFTSATIRYVSRRNYVAEDYKVNFIHSTSGQKQLQHISPRTNGLITWKFPEEQVNLSSKSILSRSKSAIKKTNKRASSTDPQAQSQNDKPNNSVDSPSATPTSVTTPNVERQVIPIESQSTIEPADNSNTYVYSLCYRLSQTEISFFHHSYSNISISYPSLLQNVFNMDIEFHQKVVKVLAFSTLCEG